MRALLLLNLGMRVVRKCVSPERCFIRVVDLITFLFPITGKHHIIKEPMRSRLRTHSCTVCMHAVTFRASTAAAAAQYYILYSRSLDRSLVTFTS